jgi:hypothetical protein
VGHPVERESRGVGRDTGEATAFRPAGSTGEHLTRPARPDASPAAAWAEIEQGLRRRDTTALLREVRRVADLDGQAIVAALGDGRFGELADHIEHALADAVAASAPDGPALIAAFAYALGLEAWEASTDWETVRHLADAVERAFARVLDDARSPDREIVALYLRRLRSLDHAMRAENALNCSCPVDIRRHAAKALDAAEQALVDVDGFGVAPPAAALVVRTLASAERVFFAGVITAAEAAETYIDAPADARHRLEVALEQLCEAERESSIMGDVYESELRAHRLTVGAMRDGWPRLHFDRAKIVYCYPFVIDDLDPDELTTIVRRGGLSWTLAGVRPIDQRTVRLTDMWEGSAEEKHRHGCESLELPGFTVQTSGDPEPLGDYDVEVRFSRLGNHYLRIARWEDDATLHDVYQAMRRATDQMGLEPVSCGGTEYEGVADLARHILSDVESRLRDERAGATVTAEIAEVHITVAIRNLSVEEADGSRRPATPGDLAATTGGSLLLQPMRQAATSLEEWIRYPVPDLDAINLFGNEGFQGDIAARTANTTVLFAPGLPDFMLIEYEEMAEFVAALPAVLRYWSTGLQTQTSEAVRNAAELDAGSAGSTSLRDVEHDHLVLRHRMTEARMMLAHVRSASLCLTRAHRTFLDRLFEAAHIPHLEDDIQAQFDVADALYAQLSEHQVRLEETRRQRLERRQDQLVALLGFIGLTDLFVLANTGWHVGSIGMRFEVVGLVLFLALAALLTWRRVGRPPRTDRGG